MSAQKVCFVVMPFRGELNFLFLYLQKHLEDRHGLVVRRGDTSVLTKALMEKIESEIQEADLIIGDITYDNPNVFYELGMARAMRKPVIFMTQNDPEEAPVDLRQFEFIHYDLAREGDLLNKLDNAVGAELGEGYTDLYEEALDLLKRFNSDNQSAHESAPMDEFRARVVRGEKLEGIPDPTEPSYEEFLLPKIIANATDMALIRNLNQWLSR